MKKQIHTVQFSDKNKFDRQVNRLLELGGELVDGGYQVLNVKDELIYSQVMVFRDCTILFYDDGYLEEFKNKNILLEYLSDEKPYKEEHYKNGKKEGKCSYWYIRGPKKSVENYKDGKLHGLSIRWYETYDTSQGGTSSEVFYENGLKHGSSKEWWEDGNKKSEGNYTNGNEDGLFIDYHTNGIKSKEMFYEDGYRKSEFDKYWNEFGNLTNSRTKVHNTVEGEYDENGLKVGEFIERNPEGQIKSEGSYNKDGLKEGTWCYYFDNGFREMEGNYKNGKKEGLWTEWYGNGKKIEETIYVDDLKNGKTTIWSPTYEHKIWEGSYKNDKRDGKWVRWFNYKQWEGYFKNGYIDRSKPISRWRGKNEVEGEFSWERDFHNY